jgi:hypothetical protein
MYSFRNLVLVDIWITKIIVELGGFYILWINPLNPGLPWARATTTLGSKQK